MECGRGWRRINEPQVAAAAAVAQQRAFLMVVRVGGDKMVEQGLAAARMLMGGDFEGVIGMLTGQVEELAGDGFRMLMEKLEDGWVIEIRMSEGDENAHEMRGVGAAALGQMMGRVDPALVALLEALDGRIAVGFRYLVTREEEEWVVELTKGDGEERREARCAGVAAAVIEVMRAMQEGSVV